MGNKGIIGRGAALWELARGSLAASGASYVVDDGCTRQNDEEKTSSKSVIREKSSQDPDAALS